jgi:hypothetical protein
MRRFEVAAEACGEGIVEGCMIPKLYTMAVAAAATAGI